MRQNPISSARCLALAASIIALSSLANAGMIVTSGHIVGGSATGTLVAIDSPFISNANSATGTFGGPTWTTGGAILAHAADQGFAAPSSPSGDGLREFDLNGTPWEPDGTPFSQAKGYFIYPDGPAPGTTWTFNLASSGIDLPDGTIIHGVYARFGGRNGDKARYEFNEGAASGNLLVDQNSVSSAGDMVLRWFDADGNPRDSNFQRIFSAPVTVTGGDGFQLRITDTSAGNAGHIDAIVLDTSLPKANDVPAISTLLPIDNEPSFVIWKPLEVTFDEPIALTGTGTVTITDLTDGSSTQVINLPDPRVNSPTGDDILITPSSRLEFGTNYSVKISANAVRDLAPVPNAFPGILDDTTWNFSTRPVPDVMHNVLIVTAGLADAQPSATATQATDLIFHDPRNVDEAMRVASYQRIGLNLGDSSGLPPTVTLTYPETAAQQKLVGGSTNLRNRMANSLTALGYNLSINNFRFILYIQPAALNTGNDGWANLFSNTSVYLASTFNLRLAMHEMGHCLGGNHSNGSDFGCSLGGADVDYNASKKILFGWLNTPAGNVLNLSTNTGTTQTLVPLSSDPDVMPGMRAIRVPNPNGGTATFVVSYRINDGLYNTLQNSSLSQKVFVTEDAGGALTTHRAALAAGQTYTNGKLNVTCNSVAGDGLSSNVSIGVGNPTLVSIADDVSGGPVTVGQAVNYTVTFDEAINAATIGTNDFENGSTAGININSVSATGNPAVFTVAVTTTSPGNLNLRIKAGAVIEDLSASALITASPLPDNTTITVNSVSAPTLVSIADDVTGGPIAVGASVNYTVTFSEAINASTLGTDDFENGGSAGITVDSVSVTENPAVFTLALTATSAGPLTLQIKAGAVIEDLAATPLNSTSALPDNTTISIKSTPAPVLLSIVDNVGGGPITEGASVSYAVTFDEAINAATLGTGDFENGTTGGVIVNSVSPTANPAVFTVNVTTTFRGDLTLQIKAGAVIEDLAAFALNTTNALPDDNTIIINFSVPPTLVSITDNVSGEPISVSTSVSYAVTFDKAMNASTIGTDDFENGSSAVITVDSATATGNPAIFTIVVTATSTGSLNLRIKAGAVIEDNFGLPLDTSSSLADNTTITVVTNGGNWIANASGNWGTAANWSSNPILPGTVAGSVVGLTNDINGNRVVTIDTTSRTVGTLNIGDVSNSHGFTLAASGGGSLTFDNGTAGEAALVETGSIADAISAPMILNDNLALSVGGALTISGSVSETGGARSITKSGTGALALNTGTNTYSGGFNLTAGTVDWANNTAFGTGVITVTGGTFALRGATNTTNNSVWNTNFSLARGTSGNLWSHSGNVTLGANITVSSAQTDVNMAINGNIGETGGSRSLNLTYGSSALTLAGANTYSGGTTITNSLTLNINSASALGTGKLTIGNAGAVLNNSSASAITLTTNNTQDWNSDFAFTGTRSLNMGTGAVTINSNRTVTVNANTLTVSGNIGQSGGTRTLTKAGAGTLALGGANSYAGNTTVSAGTLALVGGSQNSAITVSSGAKLGFTLGSPTTSTKALTLSAGHTIAITGTVNNASDYRLMTATSITGTPALAVAITDYSLQLRNSFTELWLTYTGTPASPYAVWSSGANFASDANNDGVSNGLAFLLGASGPNANATNLLPKVTQSGGNLVIEFDCLTAAQRGATLLNLQHSSDLGFTDAWATALVPGAVGNSTVSNVNFAVTDPGAPGGPLKVVATVQASQASLGKLFSRLRGTE